MQNVDSLFLICKMISLLWQIWYIIGIIFIVANGQILKNDLTIWSHWTMNPIATRIQTDPKKLASSTRGGGEEERESRNKKCRLDERISSGQNKRTAIGRADGGDGQRRRDDGGGDGGGHRTEVLF